MTDTPKDRDDEVTVFAQAIAVAMGEGPYGDSPGYKRVANAVLSDARSAGYFVARPVADEGLRAALLAELRRSQSSVYWRVDAILPLIHAREAALLFQNEVLSIKLAAVTDAYLSVDPEEEKECVRIHREKMKQWERAEEAEAREAALRAENARLKAERQLLDKRIHNQRRACRDTWEIVEGRRKGLHCAALRAIIQRNELRAERDAALAALAEAEKRCETMREALVPLNLVADENDTVSSVFDPEHMWVGVRLADLRRARAATGAER